METERDSGHEYAFSKTAATVAAPVVVQSLCAPPHKDRAVLSVVRGDANVQSLGGIVHLLDRAARVTEVHRRACRLGEETLGVRVCSGHAIDEQEICETTSVQ